MCLFDSEIMQKCFSEIREKYSHLNKIMQTCAFVSKKIENYSLCVKKQVSITRQYYNRRLPTKLVCKEEESHKLTTTLQQGCTSNRTIVPTIVAKV